MRSIEEQKSRKNLYYIYDDIGDTLKCNKYLCKWITSMISADEL
ncbi:hypothetical protein DFA_06300 [Cavenderia fasciculata]|uniref:Uncharacterized protein n=1 Tax=Cavenderia fasciculata TaxID=261658 RepID=F4PKN0_CACFS|nr:uncharacterized protein DFA_06300 [Cavenderia fasciculata]EGG24154.1 hypothetical protein DFA_06300 [Cavenderia fasciculata]|eukprot:XP_004362005.1 hypothetical protein DFA_06300 [Cavenderia fasciculata]